ncbi:hypothetical protein C2845_PM11G26050 [Panicum miliaceum]|uniref:RING-type domain-containing protein n=1 Tax=Panicum miliaceum TaxID=4540 RepID=A0A3L6RP76_PANMI|nr:hypothetical protein C2845_PM11G26050 [Panicum miliaceum]
MAEPAHHHRIVVMVVGLVLMVVVHLAAVIWAIFRARTSRRVAEHAGEEGGDGGGGGAGLSAEELGELPSHEVKEGGGAGECAVCLEAFRAGDRCRVLPRCGHGFHAGCVDSWLRKSRRCPVCRAEVLAERKDGAVTAAADTVEIVTER